MIIADKAAAILDRGGVIAYPTESVFGLGCLPTRQHAINRILKIKNRPPAKGLILIAAHAAQFDGWIQLPPEACLPDPNIDQPVTWVVPKGEKVKALIRGDNVGVAVRITTHPVAQSICNAVNSPIVSTSANLSGATVACDALSLRRQFRNLVDYIVPGDCDPASAPSEIRHLATGAVLRPR